LDTYIGLPRCSDLGLNGLVEHELQLRKGQANDVLHEIRLALADKAVLFRTEVRHGRNYTMKSHTWRKVADLDTVVKRYATVYQRCRRQMIALGADSSILDWYKPLNQNDLTASTAVADPNARGHRHDSLSWFWTIDIPKDTDKNNWMSEFYQVHWLRAKAKKDRWVEEVELLQLEQGWTQNFFSHQATLWKERGARAVLAGDRGLACYAARQIDMYTKLGRICQ
ncbi:hypothetical protein SCLCIDRAFT_116566, partial [Scleroderma citrinum Foug A]